MKSNFDFQNCNEEELWGYVASHLAKEGIETILVGGACVSVYSNGLYESGDVDIIINSFLLKQRVPEIMKELGFIQKGRYFKHPDTYLFIEFPSGPVVIDGKYDLKFDQREVDGHIIKLLSPTDCIIDRLESYIFGENQGTPHGERKTLEQAVLVAKSQKFSFERVEKFCNENKKNEIFKEFISLLQEG